MLFEPYTCFLSFINVRVTTQDAKSALLDFDRLHAGCYWHEITVFLQSQALLQAPCILNASQLAFVI